MRLRREGIDTYVPYDNDWSDEGEEVLSHKKMIKKRLEEKLESRRLKHELEDYDEDYD
jgi:hypothetical protein